MFCCLAPPLPPLLPPPPEHAASSPGTVTTPAPRAAPRRRERRESWLGVSKDCVITPPTFRRMADWLGDSNATIQNSPQSSARVVGCQGAGSSSFQLRDMNAAGEQGGRGG